MKSFTIIDQKAFTSHLFTGNLFDSFLMCEADFKTSQTIHIDGHVCKEYYDDEEEAPSEKYNTWKHCQPTCFQIIKGRRLPVYFKIVLSLSCENIQKSIKSCGVSLSPSDVEGMYLNIHYKDGILFCTSGIGLNIFTMDRELPDYWDNLIIRFFEQNNIKFEA